MINIKNLNINKVYRGCYATNNKNAFDYCDIIEVKVNNNNLFKPETRFGTQVHVTIGMVTAVGNIYPYYELDGKRVNTTASIVLGETGKPLQLRKRNSLSP